MNTEIKLGLCNPPEPIYLYIKNGEVSGESFLWYHYNIEQDRTIPVQQPGLTGYLSELRLTAKEYKGKDNMKLDIVVAADEIYIIRTGIETNFAKTFLLSASLIQDFSKPLILAVTSGEENTVFCRLYDAATKVRIRAEWNPNADWGAIIHGIQTLLGGARTQPPSIIDSQDLRVRKIRTLLDYPLDLVKEWLQFQDATSPSQLHISKVDELVKTMCFAWAANKTEHPNHAESSYQKQVVEAVAQGADELAAISAWMEQIQGAKSEAA
ncbi:MAG: hypothetical protein KME32_30430 [Mojavia pulchra JT2-VF2]|jgi:hypothetical protein|uniref:Uncharacterized protein n=1 Tax=Mojavia pulchra JT2-VF2 TaxID=287848 RepID=A0A951Q4F8_9NOST|nr:hypothetical protein [Mojavia pulchra JT2-VF2]